MEQLINFIIRPPRAEYDPKNDLLEQEFTLRGKIYQRKDIEIKNSRGDVLQCSHYMPIVGPEGKSLPCVIYCHGNRAIVEFSNQSSSYLTALEIYTIEKTLAKAIANESCVSGCRADGSEAAIILLPSNITVFTLDFSGSGLSGGEHVTLGWNEKDDLRAVVDYLRADGNVSMIGLWGRSMGAVTSLMYGAEDPSIAGMVLDSPFSDLVDLMMELVDTSKFRLPKFTVKFAIQYMRRAIQKKAKFDIMDLNTTKVAKSSFVPVLIGHAIDDDFIRPHHSDRIHDAYMGDKNIIKFEGDHNSPRPQFYFDSINIFFHNVLQPPEDDFGDIFIESMPHFFGKGNWGAVDDHGPSISSKESGANIPSDANKQPHPRRPMSRTDVPSALPSEDSSTQVKEESSDNDVCSSSSKMISFEFSNGHQYEPRAPTLIEDDDLYVEYQLDDLSGFPCSAEEEEKMIMAAMIESLKESEPKISVADECVPSNNANSLESSDKGSQENALQSEQFGILERKTTLASQSKVDSTSTSVEVPLASKPDPYLSELPSPDKSELILDPTKNASNSSESTQIPSEVDLSANTTATLTVVRNPSGHIMDGLIRRWDLNFFKNNQNR